ncbi:MAG: thioredoxin domain-containing protein [Gemmatimonadaceae bacterium]
MNPVSQMLPPTALPGRRRAQRHFKRAIGIVVLAIGFAGPASAQMKVQLPERVVTLDAAGYARGNAKAPVWLVEFADFGCSYCEKFWRETVPVLDSMYVKTGRVYWKFVPFTIGMFPNSGEAALGAICASEQGKFFQMHDILYDRRKAWSKASDVRALVARYAGELKLDAGKFTSCVRSARAAQQLTMNNELARTLRIRGTPTFFINGEVVPGALPTDIFVQGMNAVIADAVGKKGR